MPYSGPSSPVSPSCSTSTTLLLHGARPGSSSSSNLLRSSRETDTAFPFVIASGNGAENISSPGSGLGSERTRPRIAPRSRSGSDSTLVGLSLTGLTLDAKPSGDQEDPPSVLGISLGGGHGDGDRDGQGTIRAVDDRWEAESSPNKRGDGTVGSGVASDSELEDRGMVLLPPRRANRGSRSPSPSPSPSTPTLASLASSMTSSGTIDLTHTAPTSSTSTSATAHARTQSISPTPVGGSNASLLVPRSATRSSYISSSSDSALGLPARASSRQGSRTVSPSNMGYAGPSQSGNSASPRSTSNSTSRQEPGYPFPSGMTLSGNVSGGATPLAGMPRRSSSHNGGAGGSGSRPAGIVAMGRKTSHMGTANPVNGGPTMSGSALSSGTASPPEATNQSRSSASTGSMNGGLQLHSGLARSGVRHHGHLTSSGAETMSSNGGIGPNARTPIDQVKDSLERYAQQQKDLADKRSRRGTGSRRISSEALGGQAQKKDKDVVRHVEHVGSSQRNVVEPPVEVATSRNESGAWTPINLGQSVIAFPTDPGKVASAAAAIANGDPDGTGTPSSSGSTPRMKPQPIPEPRPTSISQSRAPVINPRHFPRAGPSLGLRRQPSSSLQLDIPATPPIQEPWSPTSPGSTYEYGRPTSSMIRKKSGELVKPSLKQRSLSTPHLPIRDLYNSTKSEPPTPYGDESEYGADRHKNVRFAGSTGKADERLENVVLFLREQKVTAVSKAADGEAGDYPVTDTETEADTDGAEFVSFRTRRNVGQPAAAEEPEKMVISEDSSVIPRVNTDFGANQRGALNDEMVVLEKLELTSDDTPLTLKGTVLVRNVSFQKWVVVRFTMDSWQTTSEVGGVHAGHVPHATTGDEGWDRFSFQIKLEDFKHNLHEREILMCIRFSVEGREWWDSNNLWNYRIVFKKTKPVKGRRAFESMVDTPSPHRGMPMSTPPVPGSRASNFGRATGWNYANMGLPSPSHSPSGVLGIPNKPSPMPSPLASTLTLAPASDAITSPPILSKDLSLPDARDHLKLQGYSAPAFTPVGRPASSDSRDSSTSPIRGRQTALSMVIGGQYATPVNLAPPTQTARGHERRRSWGGEGMMKDLQEPFTQERTAAAEEPAISSNTLRAPSAATESALMQAKRALISPDLLTPPESAVSSPPNHNDALNVPQPPSPSTATTSPGSETGTPNEDFFSSLPELSQVMIDVDRTSGHRGMQGNDNGAAGEQLPPAKEGIHSAGYQEFLDKYCFFRSYSSSSTSPAHSRATTPPTAPTTSTTAFPSSGTTSSSTGAKMNPYGNTYPTMAPREQLTPTHGPERGRAHAAAFDNYFSFQPHGNGSGNVTDHANAGSTPFHPFGGGGGASYPNSHGTINQRSSGKGQNATEDWTGERRSSSRSRTASESRSSSSRSSPLGSGAAGAGTPGLGAATGAGTVMAVH